MYSFKLGPGLVLANYLCGQGEGGHIIIIMPGRLQLAGAVVLKISRPSILEP